MSKGLEALKGLHSKALKSVRGGFQEMQKNSIDREYKTIEKELKAFEIIKNKRVDISTLEVCGNANTYNQAKEFGEDLTQEEYDLLKEVLL